MHDTALKRLELKAALQRALEHNEFRLFYQPVIELETGKVSGVEALIRWFHPERGMVPPLDFIPLAEETGLIVPIGHWVLQEACRYAAELQGRYPLAEPLHMAVNLSARQVARTELVHEVRQILEDTGLDPSTLILEITESVMIQDMDLAIARLTELKALGVQLAIDDFGTGYSSLNYVRRFPVDILKVDKSFIDGVTEGGESSALTAAVDRAPRSRASSRWPRGSSVPTSCSGCWRPPVRTRPGLPVREAAPRGRAGTDAGGPVRDGPGSRGARRAGGLTLSPPERPPSQLDRRPFPSPSPGRATPTCSIAGAAERSARRLR